MKATEKDSNNMKIAKKSSKIL